MEYVVQVIKVFRNNFSYNIDFQSAKRHWE